MLLILCHHISLSSINSTLNRFCILCKLQTVLVDFQCQWTLEAFGWFWYSTHNFDLIVTWTLKLTFFSKRRFDLTNSRTQVGLGMNQDSHAARQSGSEWTRCVSSLSSSHLAPWVKYYTFLHHFCTSCMIKKNLLLMTSGCKTFLVIQPSCTLWVV